MASYVPADVSGVYETTLAALLGCVDLDAVSEREQSNAEMAERCAEPKAQLIFLKRLRRFLPYACGVSASKGALHWVVCRGAADNAAFSEPLGGSLAKAPAKNLDKTVIRVHGMLHRRGVA